MPWPVFADTGMNWTSPPNSSGTTLSATSSCLTRWTFASDGSKRKFAAVVVLYLLTFVLQVGTFTLIFPPLDAAWGQAWAQFAGFVVAQGLATTCNFIVQRTLIFKQ